MYSSYAAMSIYAIEIYCSPPRRIFSNVKYHLKVGLWKTSNIVKLYLVTNLYTRVIGCKYVQFLYLLHPKFHGTFLMVRGFVFFPSPIQLGASMFLCTKHLTAKLQQRRFMNINESIAQSRRGHYPSVNEK